MSEDRAPYGVGEHPALRPSMLITVTADDRTFTAVEGELAGVIAALEARNQELEQALLGAYLAEDFDQLYCEVCEVCEGHWFEEDDERHTEDCIIKGLGPKDG